MSRITEVLQFDYRPEKKKLEFGLRSKNLTWNKLDVDFAVYNANSVYTRDSFRRMIYGFVYPAAVFNCTVISHSMQYNFVVTFIEI